MLDVIAFMVLVITIAGLPLGTWQYMRWPRRRRGDRQLLALIRTSTRKTGQ
ncbi:hypothetical protein [Streptomyces sp. NPDC019937]|uniref:hypothetical protein n=1 Tax=Streptomyces sp. NPDC019937 TaxID=3154787 RepID=UPI0033C7618B